MSIVFELPEVLCQLHLFILIVFTSVWLSGCTYVVCIWKTEENFVELFLSFADMGSQDVTQVLRLLPELPEPAELPPCPMY